MYFPFNVKDGGALAFDIAAEFCPNAMDWEIIREVSLLEADAELLYHPFNTLSKGECTKILLAAMFLNENKFLLIDEPTNHLDMESITALNNGLIKFPGVLLFTSRDHQIVQTTANRIMEIVPGGQLIDKITTYDEYLESDEMARKRQTYTVSTEEDD